MLKSNFFEISQASYIFKIENLKSHFYHITLSLSLSLDTFSPFTNPPDRTSLIHFQPPSITFLAMHRHHQPTGTSNCTKSPHSLSKIVQIVRNQPSWFFLSSRSVASSDYSSHFLVLFLLSSTSNSPFPY